VVGVVMVARGGMAVVILYRVEILSCHNNITRL
jgi:hypothetical protein